MGTYATQATITPEELADADDADELISTTEASVRATLEGTPTDDPDAADVRGETVIGWMARLPGSEPGGAPGTQQPVRFVVWDPVTDEVPEHADLLTCRGRRTV